MYSPRSWSKLAEWLNEKARMILPPSDTVGPDNHKSMSFVLPEQRDIDAELAAALRPQGSKAGWDLHGINTNFLRPQSHPRANRNKFRPRDDSNTSTTEPPPDYSFQAITCSDAPDADYTTKDVFDELVRTTREVSQVFGPQWGDVRLSLPSLPFAVCTDDWIRDRRHCTATAGPRELPNGSEDLGIAFCPPRSWSLGTKGIPSRLCMMLNSVCITLRSQFLHDWTEDSCA